MLTTAIIGVGNLGGSLARRLASGGESVVLAAADEGHAQALADASHQGSRLRAESSRQAIDAVDATPYFQKHGENVWAALKGYLDEITLTAAAPVIEKYTGVLAAADVFTESTTFQAMQSIRLDLGHGSWVHP